MLWQKTFLVFIVALGLAWNARAADPAIFTGYSNTRWGQTIEEVQALYPQMHEVSRYREMKQVPLNSEVEEDASGFPVERFFASPAAEPLQEMVFGFTDGRLYVVEIAFSTQARAKLDDAALAQMIWDKYFSTDIAREELAKRHFVIHVVSHKTSSFLTDRPKVPEQLLYPNMYQYGNFDLGMYYEDSATQSWAFEIAHRRKQAAEDQRRRETEEAAKSLGVQDLL